MAYSIRRFKPGWLCGSQHLDCENGETSLFGDRERPLSLRLSVAVLTHRSCLLLQVRNLGESPPWVMSISKHSVHELLGRGLF